MLRCRFYHTSGGSKRDAPYSPKFSQFHVVLRENLAKLYMLASPMEGRRPLLWGFLDPALHRFLPLIFFRGIKQLTTERSLKCLNPTDFLRGQRITTSVYLG